MIKHVKADSLASVFVDSSLSTFTKYAIDNGVTFNSIIYITCDVNDSTTFGGQYKPGSEWVWAKGKLVANVTNPITQAEIDAILAQQCDCVTEEGPYPILPPGGTVDIDLSNYYTVSDVDTLLASKADLSSVQAVQDTVTGIQTSLASKASQASVDSLAGDLNTKTTELNTQLSGKASSSDLSSHTTNNTIHVTSAEKLVWDQVTTKANQSDLEAVGNLALDCEIAIDAINNTLNYYNADVNPEECYAWYLDGDSRYNKEDFKMQASFTKIGNICTLHIKNLKTIQSWGEVYYSLPYAPTKEIDTQIYTYDSQLVRVESGEQTGISVIKLTPFSGGGFSGHLVLRPFTLVYKI